MKDRTRRKFLADVGKGMLIASVGPAVATDLGLASPALASGGKDQLTFGPMQPLVELMQQTPPEKLLPKLVAELQRGTDLKTLVAAGALANAHTFAGQDYIGYHVFMALGPAYEMSRELPETERPLPVLKVLYRNTSRIQKSGFSNRPWMNVAEPLPLPKNGHAGEHLRDAVRRRDHRGAEGLFVTMAQGEAGEAFNHLQYTVQDEVDVHRIVLCWRAWMSLDLTGREHAHTLLRQSVLYCMGGEDMGFPYPTRTPRKTPDIRVVLPKLLDQHRLHGRKPGQRPAEDEWVEGLCRTIRSAPPEQAAGAVAAALAEGIDPQAIGEAISLAANRLLLCDPGRAGAETPMKPKGSIHGDSVGVHASDAANAWRNIARVSNPRNTFASLIIGAFHTAGQSKGLLANPYPLEEHLGRNSLEDPQALLRDLSASIKCRDQGRVCGLVQRYGELGHPVRPVLDVLLRYGASEDGALHAEKYYRTVTEEFQTTRSAYRWRHLVGLARVTASEFGFPAPGYSEARRLLKA